MTNYLIVPGLGNSDKDHWQSFFERLGNNYHRINQKEWDAPKCSDWIKAIDKEVSKYDSKSVVLVGHSLGCATIAHWAKKYKCKIKGAMLVAPSDLELPQYNFPCKGFDPIPDKKIGFKTIVVTSTNDQWVSVARAELFAKNWGSQLVKIGKAGHINTASGYGFWKEGVEILEKLG